MEVARRPVRFNSVVYWVFLALVATGVWLLPHRFRRGWLLGASYLFYGSWHYPYLILLTGVAALSHFGAVWISAAEDRRRRGAVIIGADLLLLATFKYLDFGVENVRGLLSLAGVEVELPVPGWVLPLGLSFYVFESISYVIDVVRKREKVHSFWDLQLFIAFFPKLIAGPILRAKELLPQLDKERVLELERLRSGLWMIATGLFLKIVLADGLSQPVDRAFSRAPEGLGAIDVLVMAVGFGMQIYFDFSGYSRIAIGSARLCGLELVENFNHPYVARSPAEFWNRWHISLSRWIRDYLFYPLVGKKPTLAAMSKAAVLSMTLCGVWHGAGWSFVVWGLWHGLAIAGYHVVVASRKKRGRERTTGVELLLATMLTFVLVSLGWVFFRAETLGEAFVLLGHLLRPGDYLLRSLSGTFYLHVAVVSALVFAAPSTGRLAGRVAERLSGSRGWARIGLPALEGLALGVMMVLCLTYLRGKTAFIYFQF